MVNNGHVHARPMLAPASPCTYPSPCKKERSIIWPARAMSSPSGKRLRSVVAHVKYMPCLTSCCYFLDVLMSDLLNLLLVAVSKYPYM